MSSRESRAIVRGSARERSQSKDRDPPLMSESTLRILLLGKSASDSSRVGNIILGRSALDAEAPADVVERVGGRLKDRHVTLINSPRLLQTDISQHQITQTLRECVRLSDPGPHVIVLVLSPPCSEDGERLERLRGRLSDRMFQHSLVISTREPTDTDETLQEILHRCSHRHVCLQTHGSEEEILQMCEEIQRSNEGRHLECVQHQHPQEITIQQQDRERVSEGVNVVVCGSDASLKSSVSELILTDRRSACVRTDVDPHTRLIGLQDLPALVQLSEQEVMRAALHCVSRCHPGVHLFLLIIPDAPLNNEDRAELEAIQRIFSSRIHRHMMILIKQSSERHTAPLHEETQAVLQSFGGRHHFIAPDTHVSTLMEKIEETLEENGGDVYSTETFLETQMEKLVKMKKRISSMETHLLPQGSREDTNDLRIVLLGKTGVGKSATGNTILGRDAFKAEASFESVTRESQSESSVVNGRRVTVIDTPGLFDTELSDEEIRREITHCVSMILPGPHVFLLLIPLGRFTKHEEESVKIIQETFGEKSVMFTMVLFTRGDDLKNKTLEQCLGKPGSSIRKLTEACGHRVHVFNNNQTGSDTTQVQELLEKIHNMLEENGGSFYSCKMFREMERERQERRMKILMDRVREREEEMKILMDRDKEREEEMKKHEEEKERMKKMMEEKRQNQEEERNRREEELKREIREEEKHQREIRDEMRRERDTFRHEMEEMRKEKEKIKTEKDNLKTKYETEIEKLMNRIRSERENQDTERKRREEEFNEREERYKVEIKEKKQIQDDIRRERETFRHEMQELRKEKEKMKTEKDYLKTEYETEINELKNFKENQKKELKEREEQHKTLMKENEELMKKLEEENERNHEERKRREEEFREKEERYKTQLKEREDQMCEEMREREKQKLEEKMRREEDDEKRREELKQERERWEREREDLQSKHEENKMKILMEKIKREREEEMKKHEEEIKRMMEKEQQNQKKDRKRREEAFREREERYKRVIKEKEEMESKILEDAKQDRTEKQKSELHKQLSQETKSCVKPTTSEAGTLTRQIPDQGEITQTESSLSSRRIVLLGKSGDGKSAVGNTILGRREFRSVMSTSSVTRVCSEAQATVSDRSVSVVDTPGFFDTQMSPEDLVKEIARSVYLSSPGPHAFLIVFDVNMRFTEQEQQIPQIIEMMFGQEVLKYSIILFTHGDLLEDKPVEEIIEENSRLRDLVDQCGGRYHVLNNKDMNNRDQVDELLQKIDSMVEQNGGGHYTNEMYEDAHRHRQAEEEKWIWREKKERQREEERCREQRKQDEKQACVCS